MNSDSSIKGVPISVQSRENELVGGIKNALERGEPMPKIKQSFINAGYKSEEVNAAARRLRAPEQGRVTQQGVGKFNQNTLPEKSLKTKPGFFSKLFGKKKMVGGGAIPVPKMSTQRVQTAQTTQSTAAQPSTKPRGVSKALMIVMIIVSALILIGAAVLGLYWNVLFGG